MQLSISRRNEKHVSINARGRSPIDRVNTKPQVAVQDTVQTYTMALCMQEVLQ